MKLRRGYAKLTTMLVETIGGSATSSWIVLDTGEPIRVRFVLFATSAKRPHIYSVGGQVSLNMHPGACAMYFITRVELPADKVCKVANE